MRAGPWRGALLLASLFATHAVSGAGAPSRIAIIIDGLGYEQAAGEARLPAVAAE